MSNERCDNAQRTKLQLKKQYWPQFSGLQTATTNSQLLRRRNRSGSGGTSSVAFKLPRSPICKTACCPPPTGRGGLKTRALLVCAARWGNKERERVTACNEPTFSCAAAAEFFLLPTAPALRIVPHLSPTTLIADVGSLSPKCRHFCTYCCHARCQNIGRQRRYGSCTGTRGPIPRAKASSAECIDCSPDV